MTARIIDFRVTPGPPIIETDLDARNAAVAAVSDPFDLDGSSQFAQRHECPIIGHVNSRSRWHNEIGAPSLCLVKSLRAGVGHFNSSEPFHMFLAKVAGNDHA